ncbi:MAG: T9SS type A sorting domain-containing protein [Flavobacteriales bacterium]
MTRNLIVITLLFLATPPAVAQRSATEPGNYGTDQTGAVMTARDDHQDRGGPPANDDCVNAQVVTLASDCFAAVLGDNSGATNDGPDASCDDPGAGLLDVWYTFTTGAQGPVAITLVRGQAMGDGNYALYVGSCSGNEVACRIAPNWGQQEPLLPNTQYWLRVYSNTNYGTPGSFTLCVQDLATVPAPPNDDCANVTPSALAMGSILTFTGDATYALNSEGLPYSSIWNAFTTTAAADVTLDLCGTTSMLGFFWTSLYTTCPADLENRVLPGTFDYSCPDQQAHLCFGNLPPGTYYYAVGNAFTPGTYTWNVSADPVGTNGPPNDDCAGALPLTVNTTCTPVNFAPSCASPSPPSGGCLDGLANAEDDAWYSFTATVAEMAVGMFPHSTAFGPILEVYAGNCGSLNSIGCANGFAGDTLEVALDALVPGTTYYLKAYNGYFGIPSGDAGYDVCVVEGTGIGIGLEEHMDIASLTVHPNPTEGDVSMNITGMQGILDLRILDAMGRTVLVERFIPSGPITIHAADRLSAGTYVLRATDGHRLAQAPFVVR